MIFKRCKCLAAPTVISALMACSPVVQAPQNGNEVPTLKQDHAVMADGAHLPLTRWLPSAAPVAAVIALHGFNDHSGAFEDLGPALAGAGVAVYAYDQRGFGGAPGRGLWPGSDIMARDLAAVARLVSQKHPEQPVYAVGESMGAAVIMVAMADDSMLAIDGAVLSAPAVWGRRTMTTIKRHLLDLFAHLLPMVRLSPQGLDIKPSDNIAMLRKISRDPRLIRETRIDAIYGLVGLMDQALDVVTALRRPLLVLYGENDEIIPVGATCHMLGRLIRSRSRRLQQRMVLYPDGYHMLFRDLAGDIVTGDIVAWLTDPAGRLPSGHERYPDPVTGNPLPGFCPDEGD